jgi:hypothetical protein
VDANTGTLASDAEIQAAVAEAEALGASIPNLEAAPPHVVPVPVDALGATAALVRAPTAPQVVVPPAAMERPADAPATPLAAPPRQRATVLETLYAIVDTVLDLVNRPFFWMSNGLRQFVGIMAIVTIMLSLTAVFVLPILSPPDDAISRLVRQSADVRAGKTKPKPPPPAQAAHEAPAAEPAPEHH